jgi:MoaA/NifB/PqqE/SkfB family radical SAM enzyme
MTVADKIKQAAAVKAFDYIGKDPEHNIPKVLDKIKALDDSGSLNDHIAGIQKNFRDPDNGMHKLALSLFEDIDPEQLKKLYEEMAVNSMLLSAKTRAQVREKNGCNVPWAILMDPTSACNLKCTGCWAAEYGHTLNLTLDELDNIIKQGTELGTYVYLYSGGEPLVRKKDIITLCERHPECLFTAFTNGTLIDEEFADEMKRVKNFVPAISVEGFEKDTDFRRGAGTFQATQRAMKLLRERKLLFGISCCYTSKNAEFIGSAEYFDAMISWGAKFCWFFTYMPVGKGAVTDLMATAEQRKYMYRQVREFRQTKPLFTMDFWNDGEYVGGCIAGGRCFLHINAGGDIEPCAFIHYSDSNIRKDTLLEAYCKPLFQAYHANQPFNKNMLRPCPVLDNPGRLTQMVNKSGAHSTDILAPETAKDYSDKCVDKATKWAPVAADLWHESGKDAK